MILRYTITMDYSKFYTPPSIAEILVKQISVTYPADIIDICCGSCNLLHAAGNRWRKSRLCGVDIIKQECANVDIIQDDGRRYAISHSKEYSLVLANPPFDFIREKQEYPKLFDEMPFDFSTSRLEIEMLLANLRLLKDQGTLLIIMPSTFINAERHQKMREYLANHYYIKKIIRLPDDTFGASGIRSHALIIQRDLKKRRNTKKMAICNMITGYSIEYENITQTDVLSGKWDKLSNNFSQSKLIMRRGNISSQNFVNQGMAVLHTSKNHKPWKPSIRYTNIASNMVVFAETGDIIVSRIGKSAGSWCKYAGPKTMISDCLYVVKDPNNEVFERINRKKTLCCVKGVATQYITMTDFTAWVFST